MRLSCYASSPLSSLGALGAAEKRNFLPSTVVLDEQTLQGHFPSWSRRQQSPKQQLEVPAVPVPRTRCRHESAEAAPGCSRRAPRGLYWVPGQAPHPTLQRGFSAIVPNVVPSPDVGGVSAPRRSASMDSDSSLGSYSYLYPHVTSNCGETSPDDVDRVAAPGPSRPPQFSQSPRRPHHPSELERVVRANNILLERGRQRQLQELKQQEIDRESEGGFPGGVSSFPTADRGRPTGLRHPAGGNAAAAAGAPSDVDRAADPPAIPTTASAPEVLACLSDPPPMLSLTPTRPRPSLSTLPRFGRQQSCS
eukprot:GHVU01097085.1.p1 GENE.GHVU01097085.1~~GHVU01097085.1.p1  ORF type:complete len:307 (+),score=32.41 GHVU01097085.1:13-933(+)